VFRFEGKLTPPLLPGEYAMTQAFVELVQGHRLFVRDWGSGSPVLLMAGWGMDSSSWGTAMTALNARGLRTISYDRRGHGFSSDPGEVSLDALADDLAGVLESLDLHEVTLVGHSGAAGEIVRYISRYGRARIARVVLVCPAGPYMTGSDEAAKAGAEVLHQLETDLHGWIDANAEPFAPSASQRTLDWLSNMVLGCSRRVLLDFERTILETDLRNEVRALDLPVTVIHGDIDASCPLDLTGRLYAESIPGAELVIYTQAAHGLPITHAGRMAGDIADRVASARAEQAASNRLRRAG
jgi:non-heme chloroperoxidase